MTLEAACTAALVLLPADAVVTGVTALHRHGAEVGEPLPVRAVTATTAQTRRSHVRLARAAALPASKNRVASPVAAWLAAGRELDLVDLVAAGDALVRAERCTAEEIRSAGEQATGRSCRTIQRAAALVRDGVDSPQETRLRLCLVLAGLPEPRCNVTLGHDGRVIGRVDLLYDAYAVICEYDGDQHRERGQWNNDLDRNDDFAGAGFLTVRVSRDRMRHPRQVVNRVHSRLVERGYDGPPPVFSREWRDLFERRE